MLKCWISDHKATVSWYKDGEQLSGEHGVTMETEGTERKLIVASASLSDSGQYSCAVADDAVSFKVDVQGDSFTTLLPRFAVYEVLTFVKFDFSFLQIKFQTDVSSRPIICLKLNLVYIYINYLDFLFFIIRNSSAM